MTRPKNNAGRHTGVLPTPRRDSQMCEPSRHWRSEVWDRTLVEWVPAYRHPKCQPCQVAYDNVAARHKFLDR